MIAASAPPRRGSEHAGRRTAASWVLLVLNLGFKALVNLLLVRISLHYLGAAQYGLWIVVQSATAYLGLSEIGIGRTVANFVGRAFAHGDHREVRRVISTTFVLYWLLVLPLIALLMFVAVRWPVMSWLTSNGEGLGREFAVALMVLGGLTLARIPFQVFGSALVGLRELPLAQFVELSLACAGFAATWLVLARGGTVVHLAGATGLAMLLAMASAWWLVRWRHPWVHAVAPDRALAWPIVENSLYFFLTSVALLVHRSAGSLLVAKFGRLGEVPEMFAVLTLLRVAGWSLLASFSQAIEPYVLMFGARGEARAVWFATRLNTKITALVATLFAVWLWCLAPELISVWLGTEAFVGRGPLAFLTAAFLVDVLFLPVSSALSVQNRHRVLSACLGMHAGLTVVFGALGAGLVPDRAALGIAAGFLAASLLGQLFAMPWVASRGLEIPPASYVAEFLLRPLTIVASAVVIVALTASSVQTAGVEARLVEAVLVTGVAFAVLWLGALDGEERRWLPRALRGAMTWQPRRA